MFFKKLIGIDNIDLPAETGVALTFAVGLVGTMFLAPAASAADYTVGSESDLTTAIADDESNAEGTTGLILLNDLTVTGVVPSATGPFTSAIDTTGGYTLTLDGAGAVWDFGSSNHNSIDGSVTGGLTLSNGATLQIEDNPDHTSDPSGFLDFLEGNLTVTGDRTSLTTNYFAVGRSGDATITVDGGAHVTTNVSNIGEDPQNTNASHIHMVVDGPGTVWDADTFLAGGVTGNGSNVDVTLSGGAVINSIGSSIGSNGNATMLVTGADSRFLVAGGLDIGERMFWEAGIAGLGDGALTISDSGFVSAESVLLGLTGSNDHDPDITGALTVDSGSALETNELAVGFGSGTATFDNGTLRSRDGYEYLIHDFAPGTLNIGAGGMFIDSNGFDVTAASGISGVLGGDLTKEGAGTLTLTAANTYDGATHVTAGTLAAGATDVFSAVSDHNVVTGAALDLQGFDQTVASLDNAGTVRLGGAPGTVLSITDAYNGDGLIIFNTALGDDSSVTDRVDVGGDATGNGSIKVNNVGGMGGQTDEGIKLIDVTGVSGASFALLGDYVFEGDQAVVGGAYAYRLYQGSTSDPGDGGWYLRSALIPSGPAPLYQAGVPLYESYARALGAFNQLGTLQQRVGNRSWAGGGGTAGTIDLGGRQIETGGLWGRIEGARAHDGLDTTAGSVGYDSDLWRLQAGLDGVVTQSGQGVLVGGAYLDYGSISADVASRFGKGRIATTGYGIGGTLTWYDASGFYVDGVAQMQGFDSTLNSSTAGLDLVGGNLGFGYAASIEAGSRIAVGGGLSVTPQAQLAYNQVGFDSFADAFGAKVSQADDGALAGRLGLSVDYESTPRESDGSARTHLYAIANLYYDFDGRTAVDVSGKALSAGHDQLAGGLGFGGSYNWDEDRYSLYGEASVRRGLDGSADNYGVNGNIGFKGRW